ncbi:MAG TPA: polysaccharide deacetylase family protein [Thermoanaerobaculia bacterium]|nr:polysaccharide deacetylase family protein [Thermoanaerobaculia bacterium]
MRGALVALLLSLAAGAAAANPVQRRVAVTIDDIPGVQGVDACDVAQLAALNRKLVGALQRNRVPALGLVVESRVCASRRSELPSLLKIWLDAKLPLGNHTATHRDFNNTPLHEFQADTLAGERALRRLGRPPRYFRYPFLRSGTELAKKRAFERWLAARGYVNAPVTIDNDEYLYAVAYTRSLGTPRAQRVADDYIRYMTSIFAFYEKLSADTLGYELPQILLLHDNRLNADHFDALAAMIRKRGYRFITIEEALRDPAYGRKDAYVGRRGLSWLHRWALDAGKPAPMQPPVPEWIDELAR